MLRAKPLTTKVSQNATGNMPPKAYRPLIGPLQMLASPSNIGMPGVQGIYRITCKPLRKVYIGQALDIASRWLQHQLDLWQGKHTNRNMQAAFDRYGPIGFCIDVLEILSGSRYDQVGLTIAEQRWIDRHPVRFNVRPAGTNAYLTKTKAGRAAVQAAAAEGRIPKFCKATGRLAPTKGCRCYACNFKRSMADDD